MRTKRLNLDEGAWRSLPVAWTPAESFVPTFLGRRPRLRDNWPAPILILEGASASWTGSLNFTADAQ